MDLCDDFNILYKIYNKIIQDYYKHLEIVMADFNVHVDSIKNRIYVKIDGSLSVEEAKALEEKYRQAVSQCFTGFSVLNDVSWLRPCSPEVQQILSEITHISSNAGVGKVARVVGETPLAGMQIDRISRTESHYHGEHFKTVDEAEVYLDS